MASLPWFLRESLSKPEVHHFSKNGWQWAPRTACSFTVVGMKAYTAVPGFVHECWESESRSSFFWGIPALYTPSHFLGPSVFQDQVRRWHLEGLLMVGSALPPWPVKTWSLLSRVMGFSKPRQFQAMVVKAEICMMVRDNQMQTYWCLLAKSPLVLISGYHCGWQILWQSSISRNIYIMIHDGIHGYSYEVATK